MDGFSSNSGVIVMAATNRPETLDQALMRPGRFDRHVLVDRPDVRGREEILKVHVKNVKLDPNVDLKKVAAISPGFGVNVDRFSDPGRAAFLAQFRTSLDQRTDYQAGIPQALTLMNGPMMASATTDAPKGILRSLSAPFFDDDSRIEKLFVATLSRKPTNEERKRYAEFLSNQPEDTQKSDSLGDVLWVLLNSTEFTMNH